MSLINDACAWDRTQREITQNPMLKMRDLQNASESLFEKEWSVHFLWSNKSIMYYDFLLLRTGVQVH